MEFITKHWLHLLPAIPIIIFIVIDLLARRKKPSVTGEPATSSLYISLMPYGRRIVYSAALIWAVVLYYFVAISYPTATTALTALQRHYGLTALALLYIVLLPGIVRVYFPNFRGNGLLLKIRRSLGVSLFVFALLHVTLGFFVNLSGSLYAIFLLPERNQVGILFGLSAFAIYALMAATSFDFMIQKLGGSRWKMLHRFVYIAGILSIFHAFFIGSHFTNPKSPIPLLVNFGALTIILLEIGATLKRLNKKRDSISESLVDFPTNYIPHPSGAYPSGHSGRTVFLAILSLFMLFQAKNPFTRTRIVIAGGILAFVSIMLVSRIVLGEHWASDVIGGAILAVSMGFLTRVFLKPTKKMSTQHKV